MIWRLGMYAKTPRDQHLYRFLYKDYAFTLRTVANMDTQRTMGSSRTWIWTEEVVPRLRAGTVVEETKNKPDCKSNSYQTNEKPIHKRCKPGVLRLNPLEADATASSFMFTPSAMVDVSKIRRLSPQRLDKQQENWPVLLVSLTETGAGNASTNF